MEKLMVPAELDMRELINLYPIDNIKGFDKDKVYFICDSIYRGMGRLDGNMLHPKKKEKYFVPLNTSILRHVFGGNSYKGILEWMETAGIIIPDGRWEVGKVSQGYRFTEYFLDTIPTWKTVSCWTLLKKEVNECFDREFYFQPAIAKRLEKWFDPKRLKIDINKAYEVVEVIENDDNNAANGNTDKIRQAGITAKINQSKIENLHNGKYLFQQDGFGYRLHTSLTQLPKEFRSLVSYDGKPLVEIDISCSQLFFSSYLLDYRHWNLPKFKTYKKYTKEIMKNISIQYNNNSTIYNTIMFIKSSEIIHGQGFQNHDFLKKCCDGKLYESIVDKLDSVGFFSGSYDYQRKRDIVKKTLLEQLFANPKDKKHSGLFCTANKPISDAFSALYPEVAYVFQQVKQGNYKDLCRLLQRIESVSIQGMVCKRMQTDYPDIPVFTLHDCLITTVGNEILVQQVMKESIEAYIGFAPRMKIKQWAEYAELIPDSLSENIAA